MSGQTLSAIADIEDRRAAARISQAVLCGQARISDRTYRRALRGEHSLSRSMAKRLARAIDHFCKDKKDDALRPLLISTFGGFLVTVAPFYRVSPADVWAMPKGAENTGSKHWLDCAHARQAALYLTNTALAVRQRRLAEIFDLTPAAVCLAMRAVEDRREAPAFDAMIVAAQIAVTGEAS